MLLTKNYLYVQYLKLKTLIPKINQKLKEAKRAKEQGDLDNFKDFLDAMENGEFTWNLGGMIFLKICESNSYIYIDIRRYYGNKETMDIKSGKTGISLDLHAV